MRKSDVLVNRYLQPLFDNQRIAYNPAGGYITDVVGDEIPALPIVSNRG
jgi:hypothetical protein